MAPQGRGKTQPASTADAEAYLVKALEFLRAAEDALYLANHTAATGNAVHAGIAPQQTPSPQPDPAPTTPPNAPR